MNIITIVIGGILALSLSGFILFLAYIITMNLINGRKFHHSLEQQFDKLRMSKMLRALSINKTDYIYQANVQDIKQQMKSCANCDNTHECDEKLAAPELDITTIEFCNNEAELIDIKRRQVGQQPASNADR
jgi:hypothetical protein